MIPESDKLVLAGRDVILEPLSLDHVDPLWHAIEEAPRELYKITNVPGSRKDMLRYVELAIADRAAGKAVPFAIVSKGPEGSKVVGTTRYGNLERWVVDPLNPQTDPRDLPNAVEIGWTFLAPEAMRTSVNTEAKLLLLEHAFERWKVERVTLKTDVRNERSRNAIERIGGKLDGVLRAHMFAYDGGVRDSARLLDPPQRVARGEGEARPADAAVRAPSLARARSRPPRRNSGAS